MVRVINAGWGGTGSSSVTAALERLGVGPTYSFFELSSSPEQVELWHASLATDRLDFDAMLAGFDAVSDFPLCFHWRELVARYPDARVILTERDPERWADSLFKLYNFTKGPFFESGATLVPRFRKLGEIGDARIWRHVFEGGPMGDRETAIRNLIRHGATVRRELSRRKLLVFQVDQGWAPLARFLDCAIPDEPFPRRNAGVSAIAETMRKLRRGG